MTYQTRLWIRRFTLISMVLPIIVVGGFVGAMLWIDFNQYKPQLEAFISQKTGYEAKIEGEVDIGLLPFSLTLSKLALKNKAEFGEDDFLSVDGMQVQLSLWALFVEKRLRMQGVEVEGAKLHLVTLPNGHQNWSGSAQWPLALQRWLPPVDRQLSSAPANSEGYFRHANFQPVADRPGQRFAVEDLWLFDSLVVHGSSVTVEVQREAPVASTRVSVSQIDLMAFDVAPDQPFKTSLSFKYDHSDSKQSWVVDGMAMLRLDTALNLWQINDWNGTLRLKLPASLQVPELRLTTQGEALNLDFAQQKMLIKKAQLSMVKAKVMLDMQGQWGKTPLYTGHVSAQQVNLPKWFRHAGIDGLNFVNPAALTQVSSEFDFSVDGLGRALNNLALKVDDAEITGDVWQQTTTNQLGFDLKIAQLDMDAYRMQDVKPEATTISSATSAEPAPANADKPVPVEHKEEFLSDTYLPLALPIDTLRHLNAEGSLTIQKLNIWQLTFEQVQLNLTAKAGELALAPLDANLYQGRLQSKLKLDVTGDTPHYAWQGKVQSVDVLPLLSDGWANQQLSGRYDGFFDFKTQGVNAHLLKQNLNGQFSATINAGTIAGMDINRLLAGKSSGPQDKTAFDLFDVSGPIKNGLYRVKKMTLASQGFSSIGFGQVDIPKASINVELKTRLRSAPPGLESLQGLQVPVQCKGTLHKPVWSVDLNGLLNHPGNQEKLLNGLSQLLGG